MLSHAHALMQDANDANAVADYSVDDDVEPTKYAEWVDGKSSLLLLRWLLTPLVSRLMLSEQEARAANVHLRDSENRVRMLLDNLDEGIVNISASGNIELFNPAAERMFGYRAADILGNNVSLLMPEPYRSGHNGYLVLGLYGGKDTSIPIDSV